MILKTFRKQPVEVKDYDIDYSPWLGAIGDTLDDFDFRVSIVDEPGVSDLLVQNHVITESKVKFWVSGGTSGKVYKVEVDASTVGGRLDESEIFFAVDDI